MSEIIENEESSRELVVSDTLRHDMTATAQLARVVGFISIGSAAINTAVQFGKGNYVSATLTLGVAIAVNTFLLQFSKRINNALLFENQREFADGMSNLKIYFSIAGWVLIAVLSLAVLLIFFLLLFFLFLRRPL